MNATLPSEVVTCEGGLRKDQEVIDRSLERGERFDVRSRVVMVRAGQFDAPRPLTRNGGDGRSSISHLEPRNYLTHLIRLFNKFLNLQYCTITWYKGLTSTSHSPVYILTLDSVGSINPIAISKFIHRSFLLSYRCQQIRIIPLANIRMTFNLSSATIAQ